MERKDSDQYFDCLQSENDDNDLYFDCSDCLQTKNDDDLYLDCSTPDYYNSSLPHPTSMIQQYVMCMHQVF